ncbi:MAG: hypothetical protein ACI8XM_000029 [Haloarculaceae archaeon]|jgi:hypothetical protein
MQNPLQTIRGWLELAVETGETERVEFSLSRYWTSF